MGTRRLKLYCTRIYTLPIPILITIDQKDLNNIAGMILTKNISNKRDANISFRIH